MTEYKKNVGGPKYRSLYIGLFINLAKGLVLAIAVWLIVMMLSYYVIGVYYTAPEIQQSRREAYISELGEYVDIHDVTSQNISDFSHWVRENPYVYLIIYDADRLQAGGTLNRGDCISELTGARIDSSLDFDTLAASAISGGHYIIRLSDCSVAVSIYENTENFYYNVVNVSSIALAGLTFILSLLKYARVLIARIKRFESDVTIVSEIDMDYAIVSEGADELANLSGQVEQMRQRMIGHIKSEKEAREANTELITSISHDIRTPLTVLMGYIEMMKKHSADEEMDGYIYSAESTALRMKQLADDMFKYSLAFGDAEGAIKLEEYDATTLIDQLLSEHVLLMREMGYDIRVEQVGEPIKEGSVLRTDAPNLMRIIDNLFSNMRKYADMSEPIFLTSAVEDGRFVLECKNRIKTVTEGAESNGIGLKTCVRLASLIAERFEYKKEGDHFITRLTIAVKEQEE